MSQYHFGSIHNYLFNILICTCCQGEFVTQWSISILCFVNYACYSIFWSILTYVLFSGARLCVEDGDLYPIFFYWSIGQSKWVKFCPGIFFNSLELENGLILIWLITYLSLWDTVIHQNCFSYSFKPNIYKSDSKCCNTLICLDQYTCNVLRLWNSRDRETV